MVKIGVFDSGIGGQAIANRLEELFPDIEVISVNDHNNVPYGSRNREEIIGLTKHAIQPLIEARCDAIVIACNTATTNAITDLRATYPDIHFVGIEPMIKPAAKLTATGVIAVLATPSTLTSSRYSELKHEWAESVRVLEPDCHDWASKIESDQSDTIDIKTIIDEILQQNGDVIVLGCTHYHWIKDRIQSLAGSNVRVLEPSDAIALRLDQLLHSTRTLHG
ncbi:MAG: putative Glutamate racemase [Candidatus Saccharibacteria bacterium]|nr:putative Glutamate racemase [Candidatus Saccharibacteria bacterium]